MKISLVQPNLDKKHENQRQAYYGSQIRTPETGLAVLSSWIHDYSIKNHSVTVLNPNLGIEDLVEQSVEADLLGITDWFSNHDNSTKLARKVKRRNPDVKIVFGGPNASMIPVEILTTHDYIDFVVARDGEDALLALIEGKPIEEVPNLWYRTGRGVEFTYGKVTDLTKIPLWDFADFQNANVRLSEYLSAQNTQLDPWIVPPLALFSFRGCIKSEKEGKCSYCTSSEDIGRALPPEKLWQQIAYLNKLYDAQIFYMADDIFTVSPERVESIAQTKPNEAKSKIRAYGYLPDMAKLEQPELEEMAKNLQKIGVFNLFFGSEHYDPDVLSRMNKRGVSVEETARVIKNIHEAGGIKTTIAYLLGLPGESKQSLEKNYASLVHLLGVDDCIERLYISMGAPLRGTPWFKDLVTNRDIRREYHAFTGKALPTDDSPEYGLLSKLSIKYTTSTTFGEVKDYIEKMIGCAGQRIPEHRIGGFLLELD